MQELVEFVALVGARSRGGVMQELVEFVALVGVIVLVVGVGERYPRVAQWANRMLNTPPVRDRPQAPLVELDLSRERRRQVARRHAGGTR